MNTNTSYLGLRLPHPFVAGASPYGHRLDTVRRLEDAGWAAVVLHSVFQEQIAPPHHGRTPQMDPDDAGSAGVSTELPPADDYPLGPDAYAEHVRRVKGAVGIPVIGSLNGTSAESWVTFARVIEQAGADALELNLYEVVTGLAVPAAAVEARLIGIVREVKRILRIPVAVKLSPFYTAFGNVARRLDAAGADGLVFFNRFYQTDIDIDTLTPAARIELSTSHELLLRLHWLAILYGRIRPSLAVTGGVNGPADGVKAILAGADAVQMVSAILRHGSKHVQVMRRGLEEWMERFEFVSVDGMRGEASLHRAADPNTLERASYIRTLQSWGQTSW